MSKTREEVVEAIEQVLWDLEIDPDTVHVRAEDYAKDFMSIPALRLAEKAEENPSLGLGLFKRDLKLCMTDGSTAEEVQERGWRKVVEPTPSTTESQ